MRLRETASLAGAMVDNGRGRVMKIRIIEADKRTKNGTFYSGPVLQEARPLFAGALVFPMHLDPMTRSTREIVGRLSETVEQAPDGSLVADLVISESEPDILTKIREGLITDLSIDAHGKTRLGRVDGRATRIVERIQKVNSVDLVPEGSAGGQILEGSSEVDELSILDQMKLEELKELRPDLIREIESRLRREIREQDQGADAGTDAPAPDPAERLRAVKEELVGIVEELKSSLDGALKSLMDTIVEGVRRAELMPRAREVLAQSKLPVQARERIQDEVLEALALGLEAGPIIEKERSYLAGFGGSGKVRDAGGESLDSGSGLERLQERIERFGGM